MNDEGRPYKVWEDGVAHGKMLERMLMNDDSSVESQGAARAADLVVGNYIQLIDATRDIHNERYPGSEPLCDAVRAAMLGSMYAELEDARGDVARLLKFVVKYDELATSERASQYQEFGVLMDNARRVAYGEYTLQLWRLRREFITAADEAVQGFHQAHQGEPQAFEKEQQARNALFASWDAAMEEFVHLPPEDGDIDWANKAGRLEGAAAPYLSSDQCRALLEGSREEINLASPEQ